MLFGKKINHHFAHVVYKWMAYKQKPLIYKLFVFIIIKTWHISIGTAVF